MQTNNAKVNTKSMSHEEWLNARRFGIGGSDAGAIMGVNKWASPLSVYMDKLGIAPEKEMTEAMRQGTDLEDYVAKRFCEETNLKVRRCNKILVHPDYDWMLANIDRDVIGQDAGLECKTASQNVKCDYEGGEIPPTYYYQCLHYMAVTGASHWYIAILQYSKGFYVFDIPRDDNRIEQLIQSEENFWINHVVAKVPPLPTGHDTDEKMVNALYPMVSKAEEVDLTEAQTDLEMLEIQKAAKKHIESDIAEIESRIKMRMGEHCKGFTADFRVNWSQYSKSSFNKEKLIEDHPEFAPLIAQYTTSKPTRKFTVTKFTK